MTLGACKRCGAIVWEVLEADGTGAPIKLGAMLENGTQADFLLSDGSEVSITLCLDDAHALAPENYQSLWDAIVADADPDHPGGAPFLRRKYPVALVRRRRAVAPGRMEIDTR